MESIQKDLLVVVGLDSIGGVVIVCRSLFWCCVVKQREEERKNLVSMQPVVMVRCELTTRGDCDFGKIVVLWMCGL
jgi:hypothetical protein